MGLHRVLRPRRIQGGLGYMSGVSPGPERCRVEQLGYCARQVRQHDHDRFICSLFAPPAEREGLQSLLAFNLEIARIREAVSQPLLGRIRLQWWSDALDSVFAGQPPPHAVATALAATVQRFALPRAPFDRIIEARAFDMEDAAPADLPALVDYAEGTSAPLFGLALDILAVDQAAARAAARDVGIVWALTGLARAVPFHARSRRVYLPADLNRQAGLDVFRLFEGRLSDQRMVQGLAVVVGAVADVAQSHLESARAASRDVPAKAIPALLPATMASIDLERLRRAGCNPFMVPDPRRRVGRLLRVMLNAMRGRY
ncbi:MAG: squalene/phytoene synthase family protein [Rhodospirillales bacterium]|nr:MAG: squalene/phytoene synthase family protein [Rhodospirillales bacterium]